MQQVPALRYIRCRVKFGSLLRRCVIVLRALCHTPTRKVSGIEPMDRRVTKEAGKAGGRRGATAHIDEQPIRAHLF